MPPSLSSDQMTIQERDLAWTRWIIMPIVVGLEMTEAAIADCLAQTVATRLLLINQAASDEIRLRLERLAEEYPDRIFVWSHEPPLPSLAATWNRALDFVWQAGGTEALVVNNDVRLHAGTYVGLMGALNVSHNYLVSAVGVTPDEFDPLAEHPLYWYDYAKRQVVEKGGPDFSCFLIARYCHEQFRFDEGFIPAFCEDLDYHRRLMLAGEGHRIFSINLPYAHLSSQTLKQVDPKRRAAIEREINGISRAHYVKKWGGPVNQEQYYEPFDGDIQDGSFIHRLKLDPIGQRVGPTTPELQAWAPPTT